MTERTVFTPLDEDPFGRKEGDYSCTACGKYAGPHEELCARCERHRDTLDAEYGSDYDRNDFGYN